MRAARTKMPSGHAHGGWCPGTEKLLVGRVLPKQMWSTLTVCPYVCRCIGDGRSRGNVGGADSIAVAECEVVAGACWRVHGLSFLRPSARGHRQRRGRQGGRGSEDDDVGLATSSPRLPPPSSESSRLLSAPWVRSSSSWRSSQAFCTAPSHHRSAAR